MLAKQIMQACDFVIAFDYNIHYFFIYPLSTALHLTNENESCVNKGVADFFLLSHQHSNPKYVTANSYTAISQVRNPQNHDHD